jgi:hypothetical protein
MLRDNLTGLIEPIMGSAGMLTLALLPLPSRNEKSNRTIDPGCLENPRHAGAESTLTENVASPLPAEPGQMERTALKMAVLAPIPRPKIATAVKAKPGFLRNWRRA